MADSPFFRSMTGGKSGNGNGNGAHGAAPAKIQHDGIPIVGQPFQVKGGFPTVSIQCTCPGKDAVLLIANAPGICPSCKRGFVVTSFTFTGQTGQIQVNIGLLRMQEQSTPTEETPAGSVS